MEAQILQRRQKLRETLIWLRDVPELPAGEGFDIRYWGVRNCTTRYCLAGWYVHRNPDCGLWLVDVGEFVDSSRRLNIQFRDESRLPLQVTATQVLAEHFAIPAGIVHEMFDPGRLQAVGGVHYTDRQEFARHALEELDKYEAEESKKDQLRS